MSRVLTPDQFAAHQARLRGLRDQLPTPLECEVLPVILLAVQLHPAVAWAVRVNTGAFKVQQRYIKCGWIGQLDITGQMKDGRRIDVEAKRPGRRASEEQAATIATVKRYNGVAFVASSVEDVQREIAIAMGNT